MVTYKSSVTGKEYNSEKEAIEAERALQQKLEDKAKIISELEEKVKDVEKRLDDSIEKYAQAEKEYKKLKSEYVKARMALDTAMAEKDDKTKNNDVDAFSWLSDILGW